MGLDDGSVHMRLDVCYSPALDLCYSIRLFATCFCASLMLCQDPCMYAAYIPLYSLSRLFPPLLRTIGRCSPCPNTIQYLVFPTGSFTRGDGDNGNHLYPYSQLMGFGDPVDVGHRSCAGCHEMQGVCLGPRGFCERHRCALIGTRY